MNDAIRWRTGRKIPADPKDAKSPMIDEVFDGRVVAAVSRGKKTFLVIHGEGNEWLEMALDDPKIRRNK